MNEVRTKVEIEQIQIFKHTVYFPIISTIFSLFINHYTYLEAAAVGRENIVGVGHAKNIVADLGGNIVAKAENVEEDPDQDIGKGKFE